MKKLLQRRQGFTLIELLIVIVIIGILSVGFAPTLLNAPKKARDGVRKGQIASIQQAIEAYALDSKTGYPTTGCLKDETNKPGSEIKEYFQGSIVPKDAASVDTVCKGFDYLNDGTYYYISVKLETSAKAGNSDKSAKDAKSDTPIADGNGQYYLVRVKY